MLYRLWRQFDSWFRKRSTCLYPHRRQAGKLHHSLGSQVFRRIGYAGRKAKSDKYPQQGMGKLMSSACTLRWLDYLQPNARLQQAGIAGRKLDTRLRNIPRRKIQHVMHFIS